MKSLAAIRRLVLTVVVAACVAAASAQSVPALLDRPGGLVPDEQTAIRIAEAILFPIYGEKNIRSQRPYVVKLKNGTWSVEGTLPRPPSPPPGMVARVVGGTFHIVISQRDAKVLEIGHGA